MNSPDESMLNAEQEFLSNLEIVFRELDALEPDDATEVLQRVIAELENHDEQQ